MEFPKISILQKHFIILIIIASFHSCDTQQAEKEARKDNNKKPFGQNSLNKTRQNQNLETVADTTLENKLITFSQNNNQTKIQKKTTTTIFRIYKYNKENGVLWINFGCYNPSDTLNRVNIIGNVDHEVAQIDSIKVEVIDKGERIGKAHFYIGKCSISKDIGKPLIAIKDTHKIHNIKKIEFTETCKPNTKEWVTGKYMIPLASFYSGSLFNIRTKYSWTAIVTDSIHNGSLGYAEVAKIKNANPSPLRIFLNDLIQSEFDSFKLLHNNEVELLYHD